MRLAQTLKTYLPNTWSCDIIKNSFLQTTSMSYDILINNLVNGEKVTVTSSNGTVYQELRPPNRTALAAAKAIQNLQGQLSFSTSSIAQLTNERNELYNNIIQLREEIKRLYHEINTKASSNNSNSGSPNNAAAGDGGENA